MKAKPALWKKRIRTALDLPEEVDSSVIRIVMLGSESLYVENHRGVIACTEALVRLQSASGPIEITGKRLILKELQPDTVCVSGAVAGWRFEGGI